MTKITLPDITSGYNLSAINSNFQKIEDTLNKEVLYRKEYLGEPNEMQTNLDMNGKQILNVTTGTSDGSLATKGYVDQGLALKFDKSGGPISGSVDMGSNEILNVSRLSANTLEIGGMQVIPTDLAIYYYNETREALRRSYAEVGYMLVAGSFEAGGVLGAATDVLLQEASGKAYSGSGPFPQIVTAGTDPSSGGFVARHAETLRANLSAATGDSMIGIGSGRTQDDKNKEMVSTADFAKTIPTMSQIAGVIGENVFSRLTLSGFHVSNDKGGGVFYWDPARPKTEHNGGTIIDPDIVFPTDWNNTAQVTVWYTPAASGAGCWVRQFESAYLMAEWFGARNWAVGGTEDSADAFIQTAKIAGVNGEWRFSGKHRITKTVFIPSRQTFGSTSLNFPEYRGIVADPSVFTAVNTGNMLFTNAVFYDADTGAAFRCNEGARPTKFMLYGKGLNTTGRNVYGYIPESEFYNTAGIEFGKYIVMSEVYIGYFRKATNSKAIAPFSGNYYSEFSNCIFDVCYDAFAVSDAQSYNTKVFGGRFNCKRFGNFGVAARNFVMFGGSFEGYHDVTLLRDTANLSFHGTYFETTITSAQRGGTPLFVFRLIATHATIAFKDCLCYVNHTDAFIRDLEGAGDTSITLMGNNWRCGSSNDIPAMVVSGNVNPPLGFVGGDAVTNFGTPTLSYIPSVAAKSKLKTYNSPMLFNALE